MHKDEDHHMNVIKQAQRTIWNRMRTYYIQEKELNNIAKNFLTILKIKIEEKGHIFETNFDVEKIKRLVIKKNIDRILEAPNASDKKYEDMLNNCGEIREADQWTMTKVQLRHELNLKDTIDDKKLNECIKIYDKNKDTCDRITEYYSKKEFSDNDSYEAQKRIILILLLRKLLMH
jgi:hypothetical protein